MVVLVVTVCLVLGMYLLLSWLSMDSPFIVRVALGRPVGDGVIVRGVPVTLGVAVPSVDD